MPHLPKWLQPNVNVKTVIAIAVPVLAAFFICYYTVTKSAEETLKNHEYVDLTDESLSNARGLLDAYQALRSDCMAAANHPATHRLLKRRNERKPIRKSKDFDNVATTFVNLIDTGGSMSGLFNPQSPIRYSKIELIDRFGNVLLPNDRKDVETSGKESRIGEIIRYFNDRPRSTVYLTDPPAMPEKVGPKTVIHISAYARIEDLGYVGLHLNVTDIYQHIRRSKRHLVFLTDWKERVILSSLQSDVGKTLTTHEDFQEVPLRGRSNSSADDTTFQKEFRELVKPRPDPASLRAGKQPTVKSAAGGQKPGRQYASIEEPRQRRGIRLANHDFYYFEVRYPFSEYETWYESFKLAVQKEHGPNAPVDPKDLALRLALDNDAESVEIDLPPVNASNASRDRTIRIRARQFVSQHEGPEPIRRVRAALAKSLKKQGRSGDFSAIITCDEFDFRLHRIPFDPDNPDRYLGYVMGFGLEEVVLDIKAGLGKAIGVMIATTIAVVLIAGIIAYWHFSYPLKRLTVAVEGIDQGNYEVESTRKTERRGDEIGVLARAFGAMAQQVRAREDDLRTLNADLDDQVKDRTVELLEQAEELMAARDQALSAAKATDHFLATVSHELRTPLNHIGGYCQLLEMGEIDDEQREDLAKVQRAAEHLLNIINDILDVQKIKMGVLPIHPESFNATKLVKEVGDTMQGMVSRNNNKLELENVESFGTLRTDPQRFRQILINLISNASKFTKDGTISIIADNHSDSKLVSVSVRDTGIGMTPEQQKKLFQPFSKISDHSINPEGTGLGLVICKRLAERMGGDVTVVSEAGSGSTFTMTVQRHMTDAEGEFKQDDPDSETSTSSGDQLIVETAVDDSGSATKKHESRPSLLIIDDDPQACEMLRRFLSSENLNILIAHSGTHGLELAKREHPAVIMLDIVMPGIDGWSTLAALKTDESTADIPVILVTMLDDERKGYALGASDYITKPVNGHQLVKIVERYCGQPGGMILMVDDNPMDREVVRRILERDGWIVTEAENGRDALDQLACADPVLILLDLMMPVMDGFEFVEELRKSNPANTVPIIVMTAKDPTPSERERLNGLVENVLQKGNFDRAVLLREVHHLLDSPA